MVAAAVMSVSKEGARYNVMLSLASVRVLAGRLPGVGELCTAGVESKEDYEYIMDIGSKNSHLTSDAYLVQFLLNKEAENVRYSSIVFCRNYRTAELRGSTSLPRSASPPPPCTVQGSRRRGWPARPCLRSGTLRCW